MAQDGNPTFTVWTEEPEWDEKHQFWYWEGRRLQDDGRMKKIRRPLKPHELGSEGRPIIGLEPPPEVGGGSELSSSIPRSSDSQSLQHLSDRGSSQQSIPFTVPIGSPRSAPSPQSSPGNYTTATGSPLQFQSFTGHGQDTIRFLDSIQEESNTLNDSAELQSFSSPGAVSIHQDTSLQTGQQQDWAYSGNSGSYYQTSGSGTGSRSTREDQSYYAGSSQSSKKHRDKRSSRSSGRGDAESQRQAPAQFQGSYQDENHRNYQSGSRQSGSRDDYRPTGGAFGPGTAQAMTSYNRPQMSMGALEFPFSQEPSRGQGQSSRQRTYKSSSDTTLGQLESVLVPRDHLKKAAQIDFDKKRMLDPNCKIYDSKYFVPGMVIKVMWFEPKGTNPTGIHNSRLSGVKQVPLQDHRKEYWGGFRRFIIIKNHRGQCNCVPIYSYAGEGCRRKIQEHHGIIHESTHLQDSVPLDGETRLGFAPIRMVTDYGDAVSPASRVNYFNLVTVNHNVKVMFLGKVVSEDWPIVMNAMKSVFEHVNRDGNIFPQ